jgi:hypothetical protein
VLNRARCVAVNEMSGCETIDSHISAPMSSRYGTFHILARSSSVAGQSFSERTIAWSNGVSIGSHLCMLKQQRMASIYCW